MLCFITETGTVICDFSQIDACGYKDQSMGVVGWTRFHLDGSFSQTLFQLAVFRLIRGWPKRVSRCNNFVYIAVAQLLYYGNSVLLSISGGQFSRSLTDFHPTLSFILCWLGSLVFRYLYTRNQMEIRYEILRLGLYTNTVVYI